MCARVGKQIAVAIGQCAGQGHVAGRVAGLYGICKIGRSVIHSLSRCIGSTAFRCRATSTAYADHAANCNDHVVISCTAHQDFWHSQLIVGSVVYVVCRRSGVFAAHTHHAAYANLNIGVISAVHLHQRNVHCVACRNISVGCITACDKSQSAGIN